MNTVPRAVASGPRATDAAPRGHLVLGRFRLIEPLGSGGHGTVWAARDERLRRTVALKRIPRGHDAKGEDHRRIDREALAAARLSHPAIVAFHEAHSDDDAYYLVSELVHGSSLAHRYARNRPSDAQLTRIGIWLADALAHAHARGVIHRDVKPQNVIIADDVIETGARAKLTDFGVAQIAGEQPLTRTGDVIGTLAYMSPEQADGKGATELSDLYALALTLYEGYAGANPLRGATAVATVKRLGQEIPSLAEAREDLPRRLTTAIDRALAVEPGDRGSLSELRDALASARRTTAPTPTLRRSRTEQPAAALTPRGERLLGAGGAAILTLAALLSVLGPRPEMTVLCVTSAALLVVAFAPRAGWLGLAFAAVVWLALDGQPGSALLALAVLVPAAALLASSPWLWSAPALAPALGVIGLAAAFPALAARAGGSSPWRRAALAALGYWWTAIVEALTGRRLLYGPVVGAHAHERWAASVPGVIDHVFAPLCTPGRLAPAALWALAALILPPILRHSTGLLRVALAAGWALALILASAVLADHLRVAGPPLPVAAAILAVLVALSLRHRRLRAPTRAGVA